jgi:D-beta-D-heptose 7-phosphate kinase/D-beta-D-heptose 1-phosphate adenosyltransferase
VNNDEQVKIKKGYEFVPLIDRIEVVKALRCVDEVFTSVDKDISVAKSLEAVAKKFKGYRMVFAKGGDRTAGTLPPAETEVCEKYGVEVMYGVGGNPTSSTELIKKIKRD